MWELDHKEGWALKNWCFRTWFWRRLLRVLWTARRSNQSILKEINPNFPWKDWWWSWSSSTLATWCKETTHWKRPWCWKIWDKVEKGTIEDKMIGWHHWLNGHEFEQTPRNSEGQGNLVCCCPCNCKVLDTTQRLNNNNLYPYAGENKMLCFIFHVFSFTTMHLWHWRKCTWLVHCL